MPSAKRRNPPPPSNKTQFYTLKSIPQNNSPVVNKNTLGGNLLGNVLQGASFGAGSEIGHRVVNSVFGSKETIYGKDDKTCAELSKSINSVCQDSYSIECDRLKTLFEKLCHKE